MSAKCRNDLANIHTPSLTAADMWAIAGSDKNCRLFQGEVFLWEGAAGREARWDLDGQITPR
jgi:hypothetical protein